MSDNGVLTTIITLSEVKNKQYSFKAIDGSFYDLRTREGEVGYITLGIVKGRVIGQDFIIDEILHEEKFCEKCNPEEEMRKMEYEEAMKSDDVDIVFMDRKLSFDKIPVPNNVIAIVKDPQNVEDVEGKEPWLKEAYVIDGIRGAYFKLFNFSWVFLLETTSSLPWDEILSILYTLGREPIPEALGYNYPLFLADKVAKYYRDKGSRVINILKINASYRAFRSIIERNRKEVGRYNLF